MHRRQGTTVRVSDLSSLAADQSVAAIANKTTVAGGGMALYGGLTANEIAAFGGLAVAIVSVIIQWFYKAKANRRATELHNARLTRIQNEGDDEDDDV